MRKLTDAERLTPWGQNTEPEIPHVAANPLPQAIPLISNVKPKNEVEPITAPKTLFPQKMPRHNTNKFNFQLDPRLKEALANPKIKGSGILASCGLVAVLAYSAIVNHTNSKPLTGFNSIVDQCVEANTSAPEITLAKALEIKKTLVNQPAAQRTTVLENEFHCRLPKYAGMSDIVTQTLAYKVQDTNAMLYLTVTGYNYGQDYFITNIEFSDGYSILSPESVQSAPSTNQG